MLKVNEVAAPELARWLKEDGDSTRIIDVREIDEMLSGIVPGAEAVPLATLPLRIGEYTPDDKLVVVCRSGIRSAQACMFFIQQGFHEVYNLQGGMMNWAGLGLPMAGYVRNEGR